MIWDCQSQPSQISPGHFSRFKWGLKRHSNRSDTATYMRREKHCESINKRWHFPRAGWEMIGQHWHTDSWRVIGIQHVSLMQQKQRCWTHGLTAPPVSCCRTPQPHHKLGQAFTQGSLEEIQSHAHYKKTTKSYFLQTMLFLSDPIWGFTSTAALHQVKEEREPVGTASHTGQEVNFQLLT